MILLFVGLLLGIKINLDREKISPFECGFTPFFSARIPFSTRFFLVAIIFLIFDVELILMFPVIFSLSESILFFTFYLGILFILILLIGLYYEINQGSLN